MSQFFFCPMTDCKGSGFLGKDFQLSNYRYQCASCQRFFSHLVASHKDKSLATRFFQAAAFYLNDSGRVAPAPPADGKRSAADGGAGAGGTVQINTPRVTRG